MQIPTLNIVIKQERYWMSSLQKHSRQHCMLGSSLSASRWTQTPVLRKYFFLFCFLQTVSPAVNTLLTLHCHMFSIAGYFIPKNTVIIPNLFGAHHDPAVWPDPYSFKPGTALSPWRGEHFFSSAQHFSNRITPLSLSLCLSERFLEGGGGSTRALMPFGGGARLCLGESVARMELFLFMGYLLRDFQFVPPEQEASLPDLRGVASVVLKVKSYTVTARPRADA